MDNKGVSFFRRKGITADNIIYINRVNQKTSLHLVNGKCLETYIPVKVLLAALPDGGANDFININKGIVISTKHIVNISGNVYTMSDGTSFSGRVRTPGQHHKNEYAYSHATSKSDSIQMLPEWEQYSILEEMPIAFCVIELVFDEHGRGIDFVFRYCNKEMEILEGKSKEDLLNHSFYEVFSNGDKKWLITYADVALNGTKKTLHSYSPEINANLTIYCFQPKENFCACALIKDK